MKSSKYVETCLVSANDDFDDKSTYIYCFLHEKYFLDKNFQETDTVDKRKILSIEDSIAICRSRMIT